MDEKDELLDEISKRLAVLEADVRLAAREIYYARYYLHSEHPACHNLNAALARLGYSRPSDVGLSNSVFMQKRTNEGK